MSTLSQFTVLITRPESQQNDFVNALTAAGAKSLSRPMISIEEVKSTPAIEAIKAKVQQLDNYRFLLFVSSNAAAIGAQWIDKYWPQFPVDVQAIALGPTTSAVLRQKLGCQVIQPSTGITSEDVLKLPELQSIEGLKIAIFRGSGGRELMAETLKSRGAKVEYIEVYSRAELNYNADTLAGDLQTNGVNVISANSVETLKSLIRNLGSSFASFTAVPILLPSSRVKHEAEKLGFTHAIDCQGADANAVIAALERLADTTT